MNLYKNGDNSWNWHNIIGGIITILLVTLLVGGFNWFLGIRDMKRDMQDIKTKQTKSYTSNIKRHNMMAKVTKQIGESLWKHIHPGDPYPFADLIMEVPPDGEDK